MIGITLDAKYNQSIVGPEEQGGDIERTRFVLIRWQYYPNANVLYGRVLL